MARQEELIIKELNPYFSEWTNDFRDFLQWQQYGLFGPDMDEYGIWESMEDLYTTLLESMIKMSGIKDQWENPEFLPLAVKAGLEVYFRSAKLECPFFFGTDELGFFLSADLTYTEYLRKMDDQFWFHVAELTSFGELDLWEHRGWPDSRIRQEPWFHRKSKSKIFHLIRSSVAWEKEDSSPGDLGMLIIRWKYDTPWEELLYKGSAAFHNLYRINEALWKKRR